MRRAVVGLHFSGQWIRLFNPVIAMPCVHASPILMLKGGIRQFQPTRAASDLPFQATPLLLPQPHHPQPPCVFVPASPGQLVAYLAAIVVPDSPRPFFSHDSPSIKKAGDWGSFFSPLFKNTVFSKTKNCLNRPCGRTRNPYRLFVLPFLRQQEMQDKKGSPEF